MMNDRTPFWAWVGLCMILAAFAMFWLGIEVVLDRLLEALH